MKNFFEEIPSEESEKPIIESEKEWWEDLTSSEQRKHDLIEERWLKWQDDNIVPRAKVNDELDKYYRMKDSYEKKGLKLSQNTEDKLRIAEKEWKNMEEEDAVFRNEMKILSENVAARKRIAESEMN